MSTHIDERWKTYRLKVVPLDAPELQAIEGRRAFYAGAQAVVDMLLSSASQGQVQAVRELAGLKAEVETFRALVRADKA